MKYKGLYDGDIDSVKLGQRVHRKISKVLLTGKTEISYEQVGRIYHETLTEMLEELKKEFNG
jgi:hypothetical protein